MTVLRSGFAVALEEQEEEGFEGRLEVGAFIRRENPSPFQMPRLHRVEGEWISASFETINPSFSTQ
ncbi:hypothetical protein DNA98_15975 [Meiothermus sp. Pnk-1]|nr:hypothetical protein DNA98_15975 [Meiothermus sp. Pnk-1]